METNFNNEKSNKNLEIIIISGEFYKSFNYFIVVQFNGIYDRTRVSGITSNPLFEGNKFYFPIQEYVQLISEKLTFSTYIIIKDNEQLCNKLVGENTFELSSLIENLNAPIIQNIEVYQKEDRQTIIGKLKVQLRLLIDKQDETTMLINKLNALKKKILEFLNLKLNINITGKEIYLDLNNKNIGNLELMLIITVLPDNLEGIDLSHNNISDIRLLSNLKNIKKVDLSFNKLKDFSINKTDKIKKNNLSSKTNISINLDNNGLIEKEINEIKDIIINDYEKSLNSENDIYDIKNKIINKLNKLEQKILSYFNNKFNIELTGKEIKLDLNNKNIGNIDLNLLCSVDFINLEEINLSNNNISDFGPLQNLKKLKVIDLSFNKINNINALESLSKTNNKLEKLYLNNNMIKNVEILKKNIFPNIIEINLDNNNVIKKDIEEIEMIIQNNNNYYEYTEEIEEEDNDGYDGPFD